MSRNRVAIGSPGRWLKLVVLPWLLLAGCTVDYGVARDITHPANGKPAPGAQPAPGKWPGPWKKYGIGDTMKATFYYGPWQCNKKWMASCQRECDEKNLKLMGCIWLADIKYDWQAPIMPIKAGSRYALWHCCCSYTPLAKAQTKALRDEWNAGRESLRKEWSKYFGEWPKKKDESHWPGHHQHDLGHGGAPTDLANIFPTPPDIHDVYSREYPKCYGGGAPWNTVGPDLPYKDW